MGWLFGWRYRKSHVINPASGAGTNYQIRIVVHYGSGIDSGQDVYLNGKCKTDFGDIRFTRADGITLLDYFMESCSVGDNAVFWVEVADDLSSNPVTIYIYYGNPSVATTSSGANTFLFFDDFNDLANWDTLTQNGGIVSVENSQLKLYAPQASAVYADVKTKNLQGTYKRLLMKIQFPSGISYVWKIGGFGDAIRLPSNAVRIGYWETTFNLNTMSGGTYTLQSVTAPDTAYHVYLIAWSSDRARFFRDGTQLGSDITTNVPSVSCYIMFNLETSSAPSSTQTIYIDWVAVMNYVYPEPSHGSWGLEETLPLGFTYRVEWIDFVERKQG
jgi:hypothetical protein